MNNKSKDISSDDWILKYYKERKTDLSLPPMPISGLDWIDFNIVAPLQKEILELKAEIENLKKNN